VENFHDIAEGDLVNRFSNTDVRSLAFKLAELNHFPHTRNKDRYRWKEMVLRVHTKQLQLVLWQSLAKRSLGQQVSVKIE
jgi:hypothetical protein